MDKDIGLADAVRKACLEAALESYEQAGMSGLCEEGRWECAADAIRSLDLGAVVTQFNKRNGSD
ncbi:MAG: acetyltransferase [Gammaproteobacteria bacterium]|jgi:hypothetical protein